jgi:glycosyltransferase involved in cell wall biosynthesis
MGTDVRSLALAIPTYNRADILEESLLAMRRGLERLDIEVHVLDDSSNDATALAMARLAATTRIRLHYRRNQPALGHDANLIAALGAPDADFVWLFGDGCTVDDEGLRAVHEALGDQNFVFVNSRAGAAPPSDPALHGASARQLLTRRAWDFTFTGATVYSRRVIDWWQADAAHRPFANFPHLSIILGYSAAQPALSLGWIGRRIVGSHSRKRQSYWLADAIPVWAGDWHRVITANAAAFAPNELAAVLRSHSRHTGILGLKHLLVMRAARLLDRAVVKRYRRELAASSSIGGLGVNAAAALPKAVAAAVVAARPSWRRRYLPPPAAE